MQYHRATSQTSSRTRVQILLAAIFMAGAAALLSSTSFAQSTSKSQTTTTLNSLSVWPSGGTGYLLATVKANDTGSPVTSGFVSFFEGGAPLGQAALQSNGTATLYLQLPPGAFLITAQFNGSNSAAPSRSQQIAVNHIGSTSTALISSGGPGTYSLTATVTSNQTTPPNGNVVFVDQTTRTNLGTVVLAGAAVTSNVMNYADNRNLFTFFGNFHGTGPVDFAKIVGDPNNASARDLSVSLMNPDGTFSTQLIPIDSSNFDVFGAGDFNNDGYTDLILIGDGGNGTSNFTVMLCDGTGNFTQAGQISKVPGVSDVATVGDFNGDGAQDLIVTTYVMGVSPGAQLTFIPGDGHGNLGPMHVSSTLVNEPFLPADFNSDGNLDLLTSAQTHSTTSIQQVFLGQGDGSTFSPEPTTVFAGGYTVANIPGPMIGDFNSDGKPDIAYLQINGSATWITVLMGDGQGNFNLGWQKDLGTNHLNVHGFPVDINGDGYLDIAMIARDSPDSSMPEYLVELIGDGTGNFAISPEVAQVPGASPEQFNSLPVPFTFPSLGFPNLVSTPPVATATATLGGAAVQAAAGHTIVAIYQGSPFLASSTSNTVALQGSTPGIPIVPTFSQGFSGGNVQLNGSASTAGNAIQLTDGQPNETGSFFYPTPVDIRGFVTDFDFQMTNAQADGMTFTIQNVNPYALGGTGGSLGYAGIPKSVAIKFDIFDNAGEGDNSTGLYINGAMPTVPSSPIYGGRQTQPVVYLNSGDVIHAHIVYTSGNQLKMILSDASIGASQEFDYTVDLPQTVGGGTAYVGFTGATGGLTATEDVLDWTYSPLPNYELPPYGTQPEEPYVTTPGLVLNGGAHVIQNYNALRLIDSGTANQSHSAYFSTPVDVRKFVTDFRFQATNAIGDGFTFVLQNAGANAVGPSGGGLGYGPDTPWGSADYGISQSVAIKFDFYNNVGEGTSSTGLYLNGASPTIPAFDLSPAGIVLTSADVFDVHVTYDGTTLTVKITDENTAATATQTYTVDIPAMVGGNTALAGFTGGTGSLSASEDILDWTLAPLN